MSPRYNRQDKVNKKPQNKSILIVCEGVKTEPYYFEEFRKKLLSNTIKQKVILQIKPAGKVAVSVVKEAITLKENNPRYDQIWCVFDRDSEAENNNQQNFNEAINRAKDNGFELAISNDAFELWFLLHYEYFSSETHRSTLNEKLSHKTRLGTKYQKNCDDMYEKLKDKQIDAIKNAKRLWHECNENYNVNPSTTVFKLVETLNSLLDDQQQS